MYTICNRNYLPYKTAWFQNDHLFSGEPGLVLVDRVLALHAGSRGFDSHRGHMSERFFRSNRPGYPHPVSSELEISGIRVAVGDCSVTERRRWRPPYQTGKTVHVHTNTANTTRTDARRRVYAAMVPYRWATRGTSLRELEYTHTSLVDFFLSEFLANGRIKKETGGREVASIPGGF